VLDEVTNGLQGVFVYHIKRVRTVRRTRIIAQVEIIILGERLANGAKYRQTAVTTIKNTYFHLFYCPILAKTLQKYKKILLFQKKVLTLCAILVNKCDNSINTK
jgi:hypothetical protein